MESASPVARRLLLRRFAAGTSVFGTFLLPPGLHRAMAAATDAGHSPKKPGRPGRGAPQSPPRW
jgi:hypothetical protein